MVIQAGKSYTFTKSGNRVRAIEPTTPYRGLPMWEVEREDGVSAGKRMDVPARALAPVIFTPPTALACDCLKRGPVCGCDGNNEW